MKLQIDYHLRAKGLIYKSVSDMPGFISLTGSSSQNIAAQDKKTQKG